MAYFFDIWNKFLYFSINVLYLLIGLCWHFLLKYSSLNRQPYFYFLLSPENTTLIFYCIILSKRPWSIIIFTSFEAADKEEWNVPTIYLFFSTFYVSSAFSPCVFRIKIRFCQFSLQGRIKKKNVIVRVQKCFLIYSPYFVYKDEIRI